MNTENLEDQVQDQLKKKLFVFRMEEEHGGIRVDFDTVDEEGNATDEDVDTADLSMIVIALVRLLKDQGLSDAELQEFMSNIIEETGDAEAGD